MAKKADFTKQYSTKRCWSCNTHMKLHEKNCPSCKTKVGDVNEHGVAERPVRWANYLLSFITACILGYFIWWAFIRSGS